MTKVPTRSPQVGDVLSSNPKNKDRRSRGHIDE